MEILLEDIIKQRGCQIFLSLQVASRSFKVL
jgi:hypothetical protein